MKKKKIKFNIDDYDYLDDIPLVGWIWEFARRSEEYKTYWKNKSVSKQYFMPNLKARGGYYGINLDPKTKWGEMSEAGIDLFYFDHILSKSTPVNVSNLKWWTDKEIAADCGDPDNRSQLIYTVKGKKMLGFAHEPVTTTRNEDTRKISYDISTPILHPIEKLVSQINKKNVVMALIDLSAAGTDDMILKSIKSEMQFWRRILNIKKVRDAKTNKKNINKLTKTGKIWKSYLVVYDLIKINEMNFEEASAFLSEYDDQYSSTQTVERHYTAAEKLINGGFTKYL